MAEELRALAVFPEDHSSVLSVMSGGLQLPIKPAPRTRESDASEGTCIHIHLSTCKHIHIIKNNKNKCS